MKAVFLVGAPRSGTTWLQLMLHQHPGVATAQETHVVEWYLQRLQTEWEREPQKEDARGVGLRTLLTDAEFEAMLREFLLVTLRAISTRKRGAEIVLEKTPAHIDSWRLIHRIYPEARFIHLIRDPHAVAASLMRVAATWGKNWAPGSAVGAARLWVSAVSQRSEMHEVLGGLYKEIRYEDLRSDPVHQLLTVYDWLGLEANPDKASEAVTACEVSKLKGDSGGAEAPWNLAGEPQGFFRDAPVDNWRDELSGRDIRVIEFISREMMDELGYGCIHNSQRKPWELSAHDAFRKALVRSLQLIKQKAPWLVTIAEKAEHD